MQGDSLADGPLSLLHARGVTIEQDRAFADAAAEFYWAAQWRYQSVSNLVEVELPIVVAPVGTTGRG